MERQEPRRTAIPGVLQRLDRRSAALPDDFESVSVAARYIRFGVLAKNDSDSSDIEACCVTLRVDARD